MRTRHGADPEQWKCISNISSKSIDVNWFCDKIVPSASAQSKMDKQQSQANSFFRSPVCVVFVRKSHCIFACCFYVSKKKKEKNTKHGSRGDAYVHTGGNIQLHE